MLQACLAHAYRISTSVGKQQTPLRNDSTVFTFVLCVLKYRHQSRFPPTAKCLLIFVFFRAKDFKTFMVYGENK